MKARYPIAPVYFLFALLVSYPVLAIKVSAEDYQGAACIITVNDEIVLVRDTLSNRLAFPGGYIKSGETPKDTAARETYE